MEYELNFETEHFCIKFEKEDEDVAKSYKEVVEKAYMLICNDFHFSLDSYDRKIQFYICKNVDDFITLANKDKDEYEVWMVGNTDFYRRRICLLSPKSSNTHSEEQLIKVVFHEVVHMIFNEQWGFENTNVWISEGLALLYANQIDLQYVNIYNYPKISEIEGKLFVENRGYAYSGIYVWYLIKKYGLNIFADLYKNKIEVYSLITNDFEKNAILAYGLEMKKANTTINN